MLTSRTTSAQVTFGISYHVSSSHFWINWRFSTWKIFKKSKFQFVQCDPKLYKDNVWGLKKYKKTTFVDFSSLLDKNCILKKKVGKIFKKTRKMLNFRNFWLKIHWKFQNFTLSNMVQKCIKMFFGTSKSLQKVFLMIFRQIWTKTIFEKKSLKNASKYRKNWHFWAKSGSKIRKLVLSKMFENSMKTVFRN